MEEWLVRFKGEVKDLRDMSRDAPSRFRAFVRQWAFRGVCVHSDKARFCYEINRLSPPNDLTFDYRCYLQSLRVADELAHRGETIKGKAKEWEDTLGAAGWIAFHGDHVREMFSQFLDGSHGVAIMDPYFWEARYGPENKARDWLLKELGRKGVPWLRVISDRNFRADAENGAAKLVRDIPGMHVDVLVNGAARSFHDRFYAVVPSYDKLLHGPRLKLTISIGPGVRSFCSEPCVRCVTALDPKDFLTAWKEITRCTDRDAVVVSKGVFQRGGNGGEERR